jgi:hypothetical protein
VGSVAEGSVLALVELLEDDGGLAAAAVGCAAPSIACRSLRKVCTADVSALEPVAATGVLADDVLADDVLADDVLAAVKAGVVPPLL